jgi:hypothetical protein
LAVLLQPLQHFLAIAALVDPGRCWDRSRSASGAKKGHAVCLSLQVRNLGREMPYDPRYFFSSSKVPVFLACVPHKPHRCPRRALLREAMSVPSGNFQLFEPAEREP